MKTAFPLDAFQTALRGSVFEVEDRDGDGRAGPKDRYFERGVRAVGSRWMYGMRPVLQSVRTPARYADALDFALTWLPSGTPETQRALLKAMAGPGERAVLRAWTHPNDRRTAALIQQIRRQASPSGKLQLHVALGTSLPGGRVDQPYVICGPKHEVAVFEAGMNRLCAGGSSPTSG